VDLESLALRVKRSENLPMLSQIANTVLRLADNPTSSAKEIEKAIERDLALASKILKVANSPYYGVQGVSSIARAVSVLGMNTVRSLVVSLSYQQMISTRSQAQKFRRTEFWSHSIGVAITSRIIGKMLMPQKAEELYLAGLMHDIGMLVLDRFLPTDLDVALYTAQNRKIPLHMAEKLILEYDHAQVGGLLAERWGLSKVISNAIKHHHSVENDHETQLTTSIVAIANNLTHKAGISNQESVATDTLDQFALQILNITEEQLDVISQVMVQEVAKAQAAFDIQAVAA
jgi:HD-like signal output (HDOD) protein